MPDPADVVRACRAAGVTVAVAESLTAGLVAARIADVPGASDVLRGGVVAYASDLKESLLGVDAALLRDAGPVHADIATQMAGGVRERLRADVGVATTGVAGPDPQSGHQPGTVFVAVTTAGASRVKALHVDGDRPAVRHAAVAAALEMLLEVASITGTGLTEHAPRADS